MPRSSILDNLGGHFRDHVVYESRAAIVDEFLKGFRQTAVEVRSETEADQEDAFETAEESQAN